MDWGPSIRRGFDTAIETAVQNIWTAVFGVVIATLLAVVAWITGAPEKWLFALGGGMVAATLVFVGIAGAAAYRTRHERALERVRKSLYVTGTKGLLDHRKNFEVAMGEIQRLTTLIAKEDTWIGSRGGRAGARMEKTTSAKEHHRIASNLARQFHSGAARLEKLIVAFDETVVVWSESATAVVDSYLSAATGEGRPLLVGLREALSTMIAGAGVAISSQRNMSQMTMGLKGISQDLDGAAERLSEALEAVVVAIEVAERTSRDILAAVDQRLNELPLI